MPEVQIFNATDATWTTAVVERSEITPVVLECWSPGFVDYQVVGSLLGNVIGATQGQVELVRINVDQNPEVRRVLKVHSATLVVAFKGGRVIDEFVGLPDELEIAGTVERLLSEGPLVVPYGEVEVVNATDATFSTDVYERSETVSVVLESWSPGCGVCEVVGSLLENVIRATQGQVELVRINVDQNPHMRRVLGVHPTLMDECKHPVFALKGRRILDNFVGFPDELAFEDMMERLLGVEVAEVVDAALEAGPPGRHIKREVKDQVWRRDQGRCAICRSKENLEFDHIIPYSKGGSNGYANIQLLCGPCNRSKGANL